MADCKNIVVSAVDKILIAPLGASKSQATDLGLDRKSVV